MSLYQTLSFRSLSLCDTEGSDIGKISLNLFNLQVDGREHGTMVTQNLVRS